MEADAKRQTGGIDTRTQPGFGKKRSRFHHGLIAQEVAVACSFMNVEFGGLQDHSISGGKDVMSIGYEELIAPMIKAIQELTAKVELLELQVKNLNLK